MQKLKFLDKLLAVPQQWAGKPGLKMTFIAQCTKASTWVTGQRIRELSHFERQTAKSLQSCPTLCGPRDSSPPGSPVLGILQAGTLERVAISFSNAWKWKVKVKSLSHVRLFATPWTAAYQAPPSMGFSRPEYWSGVPLPSPFLRLGGNKTMKLEFQWYFIIYQFYTLDYYKYFQFFISLKMYIVNHSKNK